MSTARKRSARPTASVFQRATIAHDTAAIRPVLFRYGMFRSVFIRIAVVSLAWLSAADCVWAQTLDEPTLDPSMRQYFARPTILQTESLPRGGRPRTLSPQSDVSEGNGSRFLAERIEPNQTLDLVVGRPIVLRFRVPPFRDQVGDTKIAEIASISETEISVAGRKVGSTTLNFWFRDPVTDRQEVLSYLVRVAEDPEQARQFAESMRRLEDQINRGFPDSVVDLDYVGDQVIVRGKAKDIEAATNILRIVSRSLSGEDDSQRATLRDAVGANLAAAELDASLGPQIPISGVTPGGLPATGIGGVPTVGANPAPGFSVGELSAINDVLDRTATGANARRINERIVNMLEIAGVHQVMLKVTLAEVVRDSGRSLITSSRFGFDSNSFDAEIPGIAGPVSDNGVFFQHNLGIGELTFNSDEFFLQLDALKQLGLARSLSEPNLTTLSGQPATMLVGGQFPVTTVTATNVALAETVTFVPFGVQLLVLPTVTDGDRIRLQLSATVSETTSATSIDGGATGGATTGGGTVAGGAGGGGTGAGTAIPGLQTRSFTSTVELRDGESLALAGLIRNSISAQSSRVPFLGDLPVIGGLFGDRDYSYTEQELLVVVTPHLVAPLPVGVAPPLPGSDVFEPDDLEFFLGGTIEGSIAEDYRSPVRGGIARMKAFRQCEQKYIIGMPGHANGRPLPKYDAAPVTPTLPIEVHADVIDGVPIEATTEPIMHTTIER